MAENIIISATDSVSQTLSVIQGTGAKFFRIDDKKDPSKIREDSKHYLVCITAIKIITIVVSPKHKKYILNIGEYDSEHETVDWATAIWKLFANKLSHEIEAEEFFEAYDAVIKLKTEVERI